MNEELNKKLAEWAGFEVITRHSVGTVYGTPDGSVWGMEKDLPDFTQSLDACFKWLVPQVYERFRQDKTKSLLEVWAIYVSSGAYWGYEAKALCKAIEKLIDKES